MPSPTSFQTRSRSGPAALSPSAASSCPGSTKSWSGWGPTLTFPAPSRSPPGPNPSHASVAVTEGLLQLMNDDELEGVIAHELSHVRNYDILISSIAATIAGAITYLARMGYWANLCGGSREDDREGGGFAGILMLILAPLAAFLLQLGIS